jgi:hypothetical protein
VLSIPAIPLVATNSLSAGSFISICVDPKSIVVSPLIVDKAPLSVCHAIS